MDETIKESIRKFRMQKSISFGTFITDITGVKQQSIKKKKELEGCLFNVNIVSFS
jgi:hypothetical protein